MARSSLIGFALAILQAPKYWPVMEATWGSEARYIDVFAPSSTEIP